MSGHKAQGVGPANGLVKQYLTLDGVQAQYPSNRYVAIEMTDADGNVVDTICFRAPKLSEMKRLSQEVENLGNLNALITLITNCCLTHDPGKLAGLLDDQFGLLETAGREVIALSKNSVQVAKKD